MSFLDWAIIFLYGAMVFGIGFYLKQKNQNMEDYFLAGRKLPFYLSGISMVATTFAADTPLVVSGLVHRDGVAGNWLWWSFAFSGLFTTFFFADLWQKSGVKTDAEFAMLRYGGKAGNFLRKFRAFYLAIVVNTFIMAWVSLGMRKVLNLAFGIEGFFPLILLFSFVVIYMIFSGLWGVVVTDFVQFFLALAGSIILAVFAVKASGGLVALKQKIIFQNLESHLEFFPGPDSQIFSTVIFYISVQWWASSYPGAEPGGGGYIAQRLFSTKNEKEAIFASLLFNLMHYVFRPWPWILTAVAGLVLLPDVTDGEALYPLLIKKLMPQGFLGFMAVLFLAAYMSTISTHLNWGASYIVGDLFGYILEKKNIKWQFWASYFSVILLAFLSLLLSYFFSTVRQIWEFVLLLGSGSGPVFILRWFWWRINAFSEISALFASAFFALTLTFLGIKDFTVAMLFNLFFTTMVWLLVTFFTPAVDEAVLWNFYQKVLPGGFWKDFPKRRPTTYRWYPRLLGYFTSIFLLYGCLYGMYLYFLK